MAARKAGPRRLLKKEFSLDTYTWQKKYGHLTREPDRNLGLKPDTAAVTNPGVGESTSFEALNISTRPKPTQNVSKPP